MGQSWFQAVIASLVRRRYPLSVNPRSVAAISAGRLAGMASRLLGRGGGTAVAGLVANNIDPHLAQRLAAQLANGSAIVTGTNGKTTTSSMLVAIARAAGLGTLANPSGSNLMRGITSALIDASSLFGNLRDADRLGVLEVDEATVPEAAMALAPRVVVFTNLFRDQLDRYGEVDTVAQLWRAAVAQLPETTTIVLNVDDPAVASLAADAPGPVLTFGIEDTSVASEAELGLEHAADYRFCLACGSELEYSAAFYGHIGHWRCPSCGRGRPAPDLSATRVELQSNGSRMTLQRAGEQFEVELPLAGLYNVQNTLAAAAAAIALDLPNDAIASALGSFQPAFGRQERFDVDGREVVVFLAKNPTGLNQVLRTITGDAGVALHVLFFLNDGIADGRDISWIWDADYELIATDPERVAVTVSGTRAEELALRLKYAGLGATTLVRDTASALAAAIESTPQGETLYVIPTYTAMLEVRELLARRARKRPFWEQAS